MANENRVIITEFRALAHKKSTVPARAAPFHPVSRENSFGPHPSYAILPPVWQPRRASMQGLRIDTTPLNPIYLEMGAAVQDSQRLELFISLLVTLLTDLSGGTLPDAAVNGPM